MLDTPLRLARGVWYTGAVMHVISVLAVVAGGLGVLNTMVIAIQERTREIGVLRAVGWYPSQGCG